jgi:hypothetical protein
MNNILILLFIVSCAQTPKPITQIKYDRKDWKHWTDSDRNCLNTRAEILKSRSMSPVLMNKKGCTVVSGKWKDYYFPETHILAKNVDIDHLIPLKNAHESGGSRWNKKEREIFANDPENLVITNRSYNRKKGAKGIDEWLPVHRNYACKYIKDWIKIKSKYKLSLSAGERLSITTNRCE